MESASEASVAEPAAKSDPRQGAIITRRGFLGALATGIGSLLVIVVLWLIARGSPSSGRDPGYVLPDPVPTRPLAPATSTP